MRLFLIGATAHFPGATMRLKDVVDLYFLRVSGPPPEFPKKTEWSLTRRRQDAKNHHWLLTSRLCRACHSSAKHVADAQHAAIAIEHACQWVTRNRDFQAFVPHGLQLEILEP